MIHRILLVDDEASILSSLKRTLRHEPLDVVTATSAQEALDIMKEQDFKVIISDECMEGMQGTEFLSRVRTQSPYTQRILLTGHATSEIAIKAVNLGEIYRFLTKPWDNDELVLAVRSAVEKFDSNAKNRLLLANNASYCLWTMSLDGRFTYVSPSVEKLRGYTPAEAVRQTVHEVFTSASLATAEEYFRTARANVLAGLPVENFRGELECLCKDGSTMWAEVTVDGVSDSNGRFLELLGVMSDITRRKGMEEDLQRSRDEWKRTFDTIQDLIFIVDDNHRITRMNRAGLQALHVSSVDDLPSHLCYVCMHGTDTPLESCPVTLTLKDHTGHEVETLVERIGRYFQVTTTPIFDSHGRHVETLHVAHDITESKRRERELEAALGAAESSNLAKREFLATMSHEIRTPMNGIMGMVQLLEFTGLTGKQREYLDVIKTSSNSLLSLIDDILDLSKIESGMIELEMNEFSLRGVIGDTIKSQMSLIDRKGLDMHVDISSDVPDALTGDQLRLKQVLLNLLGNAIKFTEKGSIRISVSVTGRHEGSVQLKIGVTDTGIGISPAAITKIFAPFVQADSSNTRKYGGTGLGLSICARLTEKMGGKIWAESIEGAGSTFFLHLSFAVSDAARVPHDRRRCDKLLHDWNGPPLRVLLVDDETINRQVAKEILGSAGHVVVEAREGMEALEKWERELFDVILMDVQMPVMDGIEATLIIREREREISGHIPIIAVTARALHEERDHIMSQGFDGYVAKPFEFDDIFNEMRRCLARVSR